MALTTDLYSGSWKRKTGFYNQPSPLHIADPEHNVAGIAEGENAYTYTTPPNSLPLDGDESWGSGYTVVDYSRPFDATPYDTAYGPDGYVTQTDGIDLGIPGGGVDEEQAHDWVEHWDNLGAVVQENYAVPPLQFEGESYEAIRTEGESNAYAEAIPALAGGGQRGMNSLDANNPPLEMYDGEGYRRGYTDWWRVSRKFNARVIQRHDAHALFDNTAYAPVDQPGPSTPDSTPFPLLARAIRVINQTPQIRSTPELPDTLVTNDGSQDPSEVIGVGGW